MPDAKYTPAYKVRRAEALANGNCGTCYENKHTPGYTTCIECRTRMKNYHAQRAMPRGGKRKPARAVVFPSLDEPRRFVEPPPPSCAWCGVGHETVRCRRHFNSRPAVAPVSAYRTAEGVE